MWVTAAVWITWACLASWILGITYVKLLLRIGDKFQGALKITLAMMVYVSFAVWIGFSAIIFLTNVRDLLEVTGPLGWYGVLIFFVLFAVAFSPMIVEIYRNMDRLRENGYFLK